MSGADGGSRRGCPTSSEGHRRRRLPRHPRRLQTHVERAAASQVAEIDAGVRGSNWRRRAREGPWSATVPAWTASARGHVARTRSVRFVPAPRAAWCGHAAAGRGGWASAERGRGLTRASPSWVPSPLTMLGGVALLVSRCCCSDARRPDSGAPAARPAPHATRRDARGPERDRRPGPDARGRQPPPRRSRRGRADRGRAGRASWPRGRSPRRSGRLSGYSTPSSDECPQWRCAHGRRRLARSRAARPQAGGGRLSPWRSDAVTEARPPPSRGRRLRVLDRRPRPHRNAALRAGQRRPCSVAAGHGHRPPNVDAARTGRGCG